METKYIQLVIVSHQNTDKRYLFCAPPWQHRLEPGNMVICDTQYGPQDGLVVDEMVVPINGEAFSFIAKGMGAELPLRRILSKVVFDKYDYEELEDEYKRVVFLEEVPNAEGRNEETESVPEVSENQEGC